MAGINTTYTTSITNDDGGVEAEKIKIANSDSIESFNVTSPNSSDVTVDLSIVFGDMVSFWVVSDQDVTMTENIAEDLTQALVANVPYFWNADMGANPFSVSVVTLKFANAGGTDATCKGAFQTT